jgi:hypothetical protein
VAWKMGNKTWKQQHSNYVTFLFLFPQECHWVPGWDCSKNSFFCPWRIYKCHLLLASLISQHFPNSLPLSSKSQAIVYKHDEFHGGLSLNEYNWQETSKSVGRQKGRGSLSWITGYTHKIDTGEVTVTQRAVSSSKQLPSQLI